MADAKQFCADVLALDASIRFAGVADSMGMSVHYVYRKDLVPLLSQEETIKSMLQAVLRSGTRLTLESKLGECVYTLSLYKKVKRITIPLRPPTTNGQNAILMVSLDASVDHDAVIDGKIMPFLRQARLEF
ncbi:hypothetical protein NTE_02086 [Candidatus Nitrososphaera evergladensis SR1]|jgi:hypothetical protein|uniref:Uncharacterized protein n=1 Tax=Candidatus Nitrososphaera evergladensis SR1 TaxID=1459636 RepID=A0A075MTP5_9ARCH|nr:hypothetical protein [Candidatus Nitrososphaera evergladensis]AIF84142.1 hypothetical protein NTE_02086 [Candidatus Nitrososphaera evergladensis SR1]